MISYFAGRASFGRRKGRDQEAFLAFSWHEPRWTAFSAYRTRKLSALEGAARRLDEVAKEAAKEDAQAARRLKEMKETWGSNASRELCAQSLSFFVLFFKRASAGLSSCFFCGFCRIKMKRPSTFGRTRLAKLEHWDAADCCWMVLFHGIRCCGNQSIWLLKTRPVGDDSESHPCFGTCDFCARFVKLLVLANMTKKQLLQAMPDFEQQPQ